MFYFFALVFALAPAYVWRFSIGPLKTNFLEILILVFWLAFAVWIVAKKLLPDFTAFLKTRSKFLIWSAILFLLAAAISVFNSPTKSRALGLFVAFFLQPILSYFAAAYLLREEKNKKFLIRLCFVLIGLFSAFAIIQYFTLWHLPQAWWGNAVEPKRATSIFEYPNAFALYLAPLMALCLPFFFDPNFKPTSLKILYFIGLGGLLLSLSRGGWAGFAVAILAYLLIAANKKIRTLIVAGIAVLAVIVAIIPNLRYRVILPFKGEQSTVSRFSLWHTADKMIKASPILGQGLYGYQTNFSKFNTDPNLQPINFPHNIFLNFWVEAGLLGLIAFLLISGWAFYTSWVNRKNIYSLGVFLFLIAIFIHGQIDAPYLKNDLALVFWSILALL